MAFRCYPERHSRGEPVNTYLQIAEGENVQGGSGRRDRGGPRGYSIYNISQLSGVTGQTRDGGRVTARYERPLFSLSVSERIEMFRYTAPLFGIVTSRMHRISGLEWNVVSDRKDEDRIAELVSSMRDLFHEFEGAGGSSTERQIYRAARLRLLFRIRKYLPDALPDLSNFGTALMRWKRNLRNRREDQSTEIEDWIAAPNSQDSFEEIVKKWLFDLMIHGNFGGYKERREGPGGWPYVENWYALPGGSVFPIKGEKVNSATQYVQFVMGADPQIYGRDELMFDVYVPTSFQEYGMVPLEALVNKVAESLLFDELSASQADGTKLPEKLLVFNEDTPFGDMGSDLSVPVDDKEQQRLETIINTARKGAIRTITGTGTGMTEVDLSRSDTFPYYANRQKQLREDMALVYNMSNLEANLTGSGETSGRATSETEMQLDKERGLYPIVKQIESRINDELLPYSRFPSGYRFQFKSGMSEEEELKVLKQKMSTGLYSVNEVRQEDLGKDPFQDEQYDVPPGTGDGEGPGSSEANPLMAQLMGGGGG
jgi:phage portal protein BeeE